jgi:hypothetical protein
MWIDIFFFLTLLSFGIGILSLMGYMLVLAKNTYNSQHRIILLYEVFLCIILLFWLGYAMSYVYIKFLF